MKTNNYRQISRLSPISKISEKVVYNQLYRYLKKMFSDSQYGFRAKYSTEQATVGLVDRILHSIISKELLLAIYMEFSKAFDTLDHRISYFTITSQTYRLSKWFMNYLF